MYGKFVSAVYYINMAVQALVSFAFPIALLGGLAWFLTSRGLTEEWVYVPCILLGVGAGFYAMIRFVAAAAAQIRALEAQEKEKRKELNGENREQTS